MLTKTRQRALGAAVILAALVIVAIAILRPNPFADTKTVWVEFDSVQGLGSIDRDVRVGGVNVGKIGEVKREGDDARVELVLEDDDEVEVRTDAHADLRPHTLFEGTAFVDLVLGSPSAPELEDGGTIPQERTTVYVSLDEALRILREPTREGIRGVLHSGARTLRGEAIAGLQRTLRRAPALTRNLAPAARALNGPGGNTRGELAGAIKGFSRTASAVAAEEEELIPLTRRAFRTLEALEVDGGIPLDRTLAELPGALEELERGGPDLATVVDRLGKLAEEATPALPDLNAAALELRPILDRAPPILDRSVPLIDQLRTVLARVSAASPDLYTVTNELLPAAQTLGGSVLPFLHQDSRNGVPAYLQLASTFSATTGALKGYQTEAQNPLGAGHLFRLGAYLDPTGFAGAGIPSCSLIEPIDPGAAMQLEMLGLCQP